MSSKYVGSSATYRLDYEGPKTFVVTRIVKLKMLLEHKDGTSTEREYTQPEFTYNVFYPGYVDTDHDEIVEEPEVWLEHQTKYSATRKASVKIKAEVLKFLADNGKAPN